MKAVRAPRYIKKNSADFRVSFCLIPSQISFTKPAHSLLSLKAALGEDDIEFLGQLGSESVLAVHQEAGHCDMMCFPHFPAAFTNHTSLITHFRHHRSEDHRRN
jgi:hypothetical protein